MEGKKLLRRIQLENLLSYKGVEFELEPLNVLIGPNASGKSNLIEAIGLLAAAPRNLLAPFREGGSAEDWLWKGDAEPGAARITTHLDYPREGGQDLPLSYKLAFRAIDIRFRVVEEGLESPEGPLLYRDPETVSVFRSAEGYPSLFEEPDPRIDSKKIDLSQSILSQIRDPADYPQLTFLGDQLGQVRFYRGWPFGRNNILRRAQDVHLPSDFLLEDGSNLGLVLNDLQNRRDTKNLIVENLRPLYEGIEDVTTKVQGGAIQIFFHEEGLGSPMPAFRLSDGTLHYLCLLTILLHPEPPPLICIEEPESGLHPDVILTVARLLVEASRRTQLIITTHSETLISALSETPEAIVVCERDDRGTRLKRLDPAKLRDWLEEYRLGDLWAMGEIGGNR
ncbi:MAG TPA: AAA family ATPase [Thermoanaerobaculia bacterium]